jgi:hypothetical protein
MTDLQRINQILDEIQARANKADEQWSEGIDIHVSQLDVPSLVAGFKVALDPENMGKPFEEHMRLIRQALENNNE